MASPPPQRKAPERLAAEQDVSSAPADPEQAISFLGKLRRIIGTIRHGFSPDKPAFALLKDEPKRFDIVYSKGQHYLRMNPEAKDELKVPAKDIANFDGLYEMHKFLLLQVPSFNTSIVYQGRDSVSIHPDRDQALYDALYASFDDHFDDDFDDEAEASLSFKNGVYTIKQRQNMWDITEEQHEAFNLCARRLQSSGKYLFDIAVPTKRERNRYINAMTEYKKKYVPNDVPPDPDIRGLYLIGKSSEYSDRESENVRMCSLAQDYCEQFLDLENKLKLDYLLKKPIDAVSLRGAALLTNNEEVIEIFDRLARTATNDPEVENFYRTKKRPFGALMKVHAEWAKAHSSSFAPGAAPVEDTPADLKEWHAGAAATKRRRAEMRSKEQAQAISMPLNAPIPTLQEVSSSRVAHAVSQGREVNYATQPHSIREATALPRPDSAQRATGTLAEITHETSRPSEPSIGGASGRHCCTYLPYYPKTPSRRALLLSKVPLKGPTHFKDRTPLKSLMGR